MKRLSPNATLIVIDVQQGFDEPYWGPRNNPDAEPVFAKHADGEHATLQKDQVLRIWRCLMKVAPEKRIVFVLYEIEGFSGKEIADTLGINEATVRTRLFHARRELIARCEKLEPSADPRGRGSPGPRKDRARRTTSLERKEKP